MVSSETPSPRAVRPVVEPCSSPKKRHVGGLSRRCSRSPSGMRATVPISSGELSKKYRRLSSATAPRGTERSIGVSRSSLKGRQPARIHHIHVRTTLGTGAGGIEGKVPRRFNLTPGRVVWDLEEVDTYAE